MYEGDAHPLAHFPARVMSLLKTRGYGYLIVWCSKTGSQIFGIRVTLHVANSVSWSYMKSYPNGSWNLELKANATRCIMVHT